MNLKPCPFCGGEAQMNDIGLCEVFCIDCQASTHLYQLHEQAAAAWNKRQGEDKPIPAPPVVKWDGKYGKCGEYEVLISYLRNSNHPYFVKLIFRGVEIDKWQEAEAYPASLAAEVAILRHWAENLNK